MAMNPDIGLPALNAMLLIGAESARYGAPGESGVLAFVTGCVMGNNHRRPVMGFAPRHGVMSELAIQPGDAVLVDLEDGLRSDAAGTPLQGASPIKNHLEVGHHVPTVVHLLSYRNSDIFK